MKTWEASFLLSSASFQREQYEENIVQEAIQAWEVNCENHERKILKKVPGRPFSQILYRFSGQISAIIRKETKGIEETSESAIRQFSTPVPVAVLAMKPLYEFILGDVSKKLTRKFWRTFEKLIKDTSLWYGDKEKCAKILLGTMNKATIPVLKELRSAQKVKLEVLYVERMFGLMQFFFKKVFFITTEQKKVLVFEWKVWNSLVKQHLKARLDSGWLKVFPQEKIQKIETKNVQAARMSFIPAGKKLRLVAPIKKQLMRVEKREIIYRHGETGKIRIKNKASEEEMQEMFSAKLRFIRWIATSESVDNIQSIPMKRILPVLQNIDTASCVLAKTDVRSAYDGILINKAYSYFLEKFRHRYGRIRDSGWILYRKEEGSFVFVEESELGVFDDYDYKCFRIDDITRLMQFSSKWIPLKWKKKYFSPKFLLHSSPMSSPLAELYIKDMLNVSYKMTNIPDLKITQYMDDILIQASSKSEIATYYDALKTVLHLHDLSFDNINFVGYDICTSSGAVTKKLRRVDPNFKKNADLRSQISYLDFTVKSRTGRCLRQDIILPLDADSIRKAVFHLNRELAYCYKATSKHFLLRNSSLLESPEDFFRKIYRRVSSRLDRNEKNFLTEKDHQVMRKKFFTVSAKSSIYSCKGLK